jgi:hypothetical protein
LLQSELASLNARLELQRAEQELRARSFGLRSYLGLRDTDDVRPLITFQVPEVTADVATALAQGRANRAVVVAQRRQKLEAERDLAEARSQPGRSVDLFMSLGLNQSTNDVGSLYDMGQEHERATLGIQVPILDWGRAHARSRLAESNAEVTMLSVEQAGLDLEQDVTRAVLEFNVQSERMRIAAKADDVASRRYAAAEQRALRRGRCRGPERGARREGLRAACALRSVARLLDRQFPAPAHDRVRLRVPAADRHRGARGLTAAGRRVSAASDPSRSAATSGRAASRTRIAARPPRRTRSAG